MDWFVFGETKITKISIFNQIADFGVMVDRIELYGDANANAMVSYLKTIKYIEYLGATEQ